MSHNNIFDISMVTNNHGQFYKYFFIKEFPLYFYNIFAYFYFEKMFFRIQM